jgi:ABC-type dipeptide/oligopeptide/nickel transport system permease subunit
MREFLNKIGRFLIRVFGVIVAVLAYVVAQIIIGSAIAGRYIYDNFLKKIGLAVGGFMAKLFKHPRGRIGLIIIGCLIFVAVFAPYLAPYDLSKGTLGVPTNAPPSWQHIFGTDSGGRDILSLLINGTATSLSIGLITGVLIMLLGAMMGIIAGYVSGAAEQIIMRVVDVLLVIPTLPITIVLTNVLGRSYWVIIFIFVLFGWTGLTRIIRSQVLVIKNANYVRAAELAGASKWYIMTKHILPGVSHLLIMSGALTCAGIIIAEAGLSFLGLGNPNGTSWGLMLAEGNKIENGYAMLITSGCAIFITVMAFMFVGFAMEDIFNPRMKQNGNIYKVYKKTDKNYIQNIFDSMNENDTGV